MNKQCRKNITHIFNDMLNKSFHTVKIVENKRILFINDEEIHEFCHERDYRKKVFNREEFSISEIIGCLSDLEDAPLREASSTYQDRKVGGGIQAKMAFVFGTKKGTVIVRWIGESAGCDSISISHNVKKIIDSDDWQDYWDMVYMLHESQYPLSKKSSTS